MGVTCPGNRTAEAQKGQDRKKGLELRGVQGVIGVLFS